MLKDNLKTLRKNKGLSQEELSIKLNVVRQTISKWETGLSVPDTEMLIKISELFETPVSEILGESIEEKETNDLMNVLGVTKEQIDNIMNMSPVFDEYSADTKRKPMYLNLPLVVFSSELYRLGKKEDAFFVYFII